MRITEQKKRADKAEREKWDAKKEAEIKVGRGECRENDVS